jgi:hypothetical protein
MLADVVLQALDAGGELAIPSMAGRNEVVV